MASQETVKPETKSASPGQNGLVSCKAPDVSSALKMTRKRYNICPLGQPPVTKETRY